MHLTNQIALVGSGEVGLSDPDDCHVYLVDGGSEYALIDAGCGSEQSIAMIVATMARDGFDPALLKTVLLTHWHGDHGGGAWRWRAQFGCQIVAPAGERHFTEQGRDGVTACPVDRGIADGETIQIGALELVAHCIPGHSEATTAYRLGPIGDCALFSADVVFANGIIGLINYPGSDLATYREQLPRLAGLGVQALLPGHLLFTLGNGQRHIDLAIRRLATDPFLPYSIGQLGASFIPSKWF